TSTSPPASSAPPSWSTPARSPTSWPGSRRARCWRRPPISATMAPPPRCAGAGACRGRRSSCRPPPTPPSSSTTSSPPAATAPAAVPASARAPQPTGPLPVARLAVYDPAAAVVLDETAIANLELVHTLIGARKQGSLLAVLDDTATAPGARLLRRWLLYPL